MPENLTSYFMVMFLSVWGKFITAKLPHFWKQSSHHLLLPLTKTKILQTVLKWERAFFFFFSFCSGKWQLKYFFFCKHYAEHRVMHTNASLSCTFETRASSWLMLVPICWWRRKEARGRRELYRLCLPYCNCDGVQCERELLGKSVLFYLDSCYFWRKTNHSGCREAPADPWGWPDLERLCVADMSFFLQLYQLVSKNKNKKPPFSTHFKKVEAVRCIILLL